MAVVKRCGEFRASPRHLSAPAKDLSSMSVILANVSEPEPRERQIPLHQIGTGQHARMTEVYVVVHVDAAHVHANFVPRSGLNSDLRP